MASVRASYRYANGPTIDIQTWADDSYPEALAVARANTIEGLREALNMIAEDDDQLTADEFEALNHDEAEE